MGKYQTRFVNKTVIGALVRKLKENLIDKPMAMRKYMFVFVFISGL
jgi:hypothetical protein